MSMDIDLIFKIAAVGMVVLMILVQEIADLFALVKRLFDF